MHDVEQLPIAVHRTRFNEQGRAIFVKNDTTPARQLRHDHELAHAGTFRPWRQRILTGALTLALTGGVLTGAPVLVAAQDGTGAATPTPPSNCVVPVASASGVSETSAIAATPAGTAVAATPAAVASPVAVSGLQDDLAATAKAITSCLSEGNAEGLVKLTSDTFRGQLFGSDEPISASDYIALSKSLTKIPYAVLAVAEATNSGNDTATATVTYTIGKQVRTGEWSFTRAEIDGHAAWVLESETPTAVEAPATAAKVDVTIKGNAFTLSNAKLSSGDVAFSVKNEDKEDHEMFVVQLSSGTKVDALLTNPGPGLPKGVIFIGQVTVPAGSEGELVLTGLGKGTYTVVDLLPGEEGTPHLSAGMSTTFTVE